MTEKTTGDLINYTGTLSGVTHRTTRQGRPWATADLIHDGEVTELRIFPNAFEALREIVREGAEVAVSVRPPGVVEAMSSGGFDWRKPVPDDEGARREIEARLNGVALRGEEA